MLYNNCIVDKNCRIGDDVRINGGKTFKDDETDTYLVKDGIVVIKKGATIAKGTVINNISYISKIKLQILATVFSDFDINLFKAGKHYKLYEKFGSHILQ